MTTSPVVWRGSANAWECDHLGHLNTRFYLARVELALAGLLRRLDVDVGATTIRSQHMRFHREVRAGQAIEAIGGVLRWDGREAEVLVTLSHAPGGETAATFRLVIAPGVGGWRDSATDFIIAVSTEAQPRGLSLEADVAAPSSDRADALGLQRTGLTTVLPDQCDAHGVWRPSAAMGLIADSVAHLRHGEWRELLADTPDGPRRIGGALVEFAFAHTRWPRAGDGVEVRSALTGCTDRVTRTAHWLLDPLSGAAWASVRTVGVALDLDARRLVTLTPAAQDAYNGASVAGV